MRRTANRLAREISPYLLQHAQNPVDWFPWGDEAFELARARDKPVLLSIGYAACHYCHVMERESFANEAIAAKMNEGFICIKVDREERPDLDEVYMAATVALSGSGGWPMTVFLTPDGEPFFAGTYFPKEDRAGRPGLPALLSRISEMWRGDRKTLVEQAQQLTQHIRSTHRAVAPGSVSEDTLRSACRALARSFDESFGGFGRAPKFPQPAALALLLRCYRRTQQRELLNMVTRTLDGMMSGGMYDQLGGGFARYSVDQSWLVPHFEKMLSDNAQLAEAYIEGFQVTGHAPYRRIARETLDYAVSEMQSPDGGFFSSSDADSEGEEGKYFTFTRAEIESVLGEPTATHFCAFYGVTSEGNLAGRNVLSARRPLAEVAKDFGIDQAQLIESLEIGREKLLAFRKTRIPPEVDDKIVASFNGLMIRALAQGARAFGETRYLDAARRAADFILAPTSAGPGMRSDDGRLFRVARSGLTSKSAYLDDYAFVADGLLSLYEAGGGQRYLKESVSLTERMLSEFSADNSGALFLAGASAEQLISQPRPGSDSALPSGNAVASRVLARLAIHAGRPEWTERAIDIISSFSAPLRQSPRAYCALLCSVDFLLEAPLEIVLSGSQTDESVADMARCLGSQFLPQRVEARVFEPPEFPSPLTQDRFEPGAPGRAFVCESYVCSRPATSATELMALLDESERLALTARRRELGTQSLAGRATPEATEAAARSGSLPESAYGKLDSLTITRIGLGTHRIGLDRSEHRVAVTEALTSGINLIDTSPTFAFGDSERLVGQVLRDLCGDGTLTRAALVVVSKIGVALGLQAENLERRRKSGSLQHTCALTSKQSAAPAPPELGSGAFSLDQTFVSEQIEASLERLGLLHLDVCLIQSPEHFLAAGRSKEELREALFAAFSRLEEEVGRGRVGRYGMLCNTAARDAADPLYIDIDWTVEIAREVAGEGHHFRVLELPVSVAERDALQQEPAGSLVERAAAHGLSVLACRPLSPVVNGALLRLVDPPPSPDSATAASLRSARYQVASLEAEFETTFAAQLRLAGRMDAGAALPLSGPLGQALEQVATRDQFELAETTMVTPRIRHLLAQLDRAFAGPGEEKWLKFRAKYVHAVGAWLAAVRELATERSRELLAELEVALRESPEFGGLVKPQEGSGSWFSRALGLLLTRKELSSALVGLRDVNQVKEAVSVLRAG